MILKKSDLKNGCILRCNKSDTKYYTIGGYYCVVKEPTGELASDGEEKITLSDNDGVTHNWSVEALLRENEYKDWNVQFELV